MLSGLKEETDIVLRIHGRGDLPVLIYLPGLHGDWTLVGSFRKALEGRVRFVEMTYPRTLSWSLREYGTHVVEALEAAGIKGGWLLGESFGSQVVWPILQDGRFRPEGVVLAGGFVRHPMRWAVGMAERIGGATPLRVITAVLFGYAKLARFRFRKSPDVAAGINEFVVRRTELDRQAAVHRLRLILHNDPCPVASGTSVPLYCITGLVDPVVPWMFVRRWLRGNCPALRDYRIVRGADHNVLGTASKEAAERVLGWMIGMQNERNR